MMLSKFWKKPAFNTEKIDWLFDHFAWLLSNYGGHQSFLKSYHLVMSKPNDFPSMSCATDSEVERVFRSVMQHMGMGTWEVDLVPMGSESDIDLDDFQKDESDLSMEYSDDGVGGYFHLSSCGKATIGYGDHLVSDFTSFVALLSHEAAHYLLTKSITEMPGGWKDLEPVTDLTAIMTGFGLFQANTASIVNHNAGGQSASRSGYLPESARAYALAIFSELSMLESKFVAKQLRINPRASYRLAITDIRNNRQREMKELEDLTPLRNW